LSILVAGAPVQFVSLPLGLAWTEFLILLAALLYVRRKGLLAAAALGWKPVTLGIALRAAVLGITAWGIAGALYYLVSCPLFGEPPGAGGMSPRSVPQWLLLLVVGAILPGICEEALFRGAIFGVLQRKTPTRAITISALLFAVYHLSPWNLLPAFFLGVLLGKLRERTGSIVPGMVAHACSNATAFTVAFLAGENKDASHAAIVLGVPSLLFGVAAWEFARHTKLFQPPASPLAEVPAALSRRFWLALGLVILLAVGLLVVLRTTIEMQKHRTPRSNASATTILDNWVTDLKKTLS
jgi:membrane protease YdiL (CAAX protease family)